jgi:hypothetical protein
MNPFGNLPVRAFGAHVVMDTNDRFQFPAIVRTGNFDSGVFGTSSSKLLDPAWLERAFGGRFANLAFNDGRAWEEYQLALLFLRTVPRPGTLLFGIDWVWCAADADVSPVHRSRLSAVDLRREPVERLAVRLELAERRRPRRGSLPTVPGCCRRAFPPTASISSCRRTPPTTPPRPGNMSGAAERARSCRTAPPTWSRTPTARAGNIRRWHGSTSLPPKPLPARA